MMSLKILQLKLKTETLPLTQLPELMKKESTLLYVSSKKAKILQLLIDHLHILHYSKKISFSPECMVHLNSSKNSSMLKHSLQ